MMNKHVIINHLVISSDPRSAYYASSTFLKYSTRQDVDDLSSQPFLLHPSISRLYLDINPFNEYLRPPFFFSLLFNKKKDQSRLRIWIVGFHSFLLRHSQLIVISTPFIAFPETTLDLCCIMIHQWYVYYIVFFRGRYNIYIYTLIYSFNSIS